MSNEASHAVDIFKLAGLLLGAYAAILSTYNFVLAHIGWIIIDFQAMEAGGELLGKIRVFCAGRPRFIEDVIVTDPAGRVVLQDDIMERLGRGEARKISLERRSFRENGRYSVTVNSERRSFEASFDI